MKTFSEFKAFLEEQLKDDLDALEKRRYRMRYWRGRLGGILLGVITLSWALAYLYGNVSLYIILATVAVTAPIVFFVYRKYFLDETIPENFKDLIVKNLITFVDPSLNYFPEDYVPYEHFEASKLFMSVSNKWFDRRIKGLLPKEIKVAHKTGTARTYNGLTRATNDAGIITLPNGKHLAISVFVSDSYDSQEKREMTIAKASKAAYDYFLK